MCAMPRGGGSGGCEDAELKSTWTSAEEGLRVGGCAKRDGNELREVLLPPALLGARSDAPSLLEVRSIGAGHGDRVSMVLEMMESRRRCCHGNSKVLDFPAKSGSRTRVKKV